MTSELNQTESASGSPEDRSAAASPAAAIGSGFGVFVLLIALVLAAGIGFSTIMKRGVQPVETSDQEWNGGAMAGKELPAVEAAGWINTEGVSSDELKGNVVVLHGWFVDCPYCWKEAPELVELHEKYSGQGVKFVGLTHEQGEMIPRIQGFVEDNRITWPQGYGALDTLMALNAEYFPVVWVIGRDGRIFWSTDGPGTIDQAIRLALAG